MRTKKTISDFPTHNESPVIKYREDNYVRVSRKCLDIQVKMSNNTSKLFAWMCANMTNTYLIKIEPNLLYKELNYKTRKSVYDGIYELLEFGVIYRKTGRYPFFYINHNLVHLSK